MHPDKGFSNFIEKVYSIYGSQDNLFTEADTRAKLIDTIFKDCLGWSEHNISRENKIDAGRVDYIFSYQGIPLIVVEAKRTGAYFEIPKTIINRTYKIKGSISSVTTLIDAMNQARNYCNDIGCKYAAVFNGYQIVIFTAITIGKSWKDGTCLVINSLDDFKNNFNILWNILAYENVIRGALIDYFEKGTSAITFDKVISNIHNPDQTWARNELYTYNRPIADFVFSELIDEKQTEVLKNCYVYGNTSELSEELKDYFRDKIPYFSQEFRIKDIYQDEAKAGGFQKEYLEKVYDATKGSVIVILGGIGSGKSTFIHRFFRLVLSSHENMLWFYIDFRTAPLDQQELENYLLQRILDDWGFKYALKFTQLIEDHGFSINPDNSKEYLSKLFNLLHALKFSTTIIIDNVDQLETKLQEKIFLLTHHISDILKSVSIIALREETFLASTRLGVFDAYSIPKFHIFVS